MDQETLLTEMEFNPVLASTGQRFANYIVDLIAFYVVITFGIGAILYATDDTLFVGIDDDSFVANLIFRIVFLIIYAFLYFLVELIFKGRTIGKLITGTKAVNQDGSAMEPKTILIRSLSRAVPFEQLSALGGFPWHDKWSRTYVIDIKKTQANNINQQ